MVGKQTRNFMKNLFEYQSFINTNLKSDSAKKNCAHLFCVYRDMYYATRKLIDESAYSKAEILKQIDTMYENMNLLYQEHQNQENLAKRSIFKKLLDLITFRSWKKK